MAETDQQGLVSGARTVVHMADYLAELQQTAIALKLEIDPQGRGYFAPDEEEQAHAILISYWQTRCALHELIDEMVGRRVYADPNQMGTGDVDITATDQRFLIGFAAALLLVDAARFLRSLAEGRPVIRRKLNQPVPAFGVEGGTYDTVQKSMLSTRRGWKLIQARRYFRMHRARLLAATASSADADLMKRVFEIVDEMVARINVPWSRFFYAKYLTMLDRVSRRLGRKFYNRTVYNLQQFGSEIVADVYVKRGHKPELPAESKREVLAHAQPGDVFVVRKEHALTNYFLPGFWPHAALYLGTLDQLQAMGIGGDEHFDARLDTLQNIGGHLVLEAMKDGVNLRSVESAFGCDSIVVIRPALEEADVARALARVLQHEGKRYDFDFDFSRSDRLVCTEVVYRAYDGLGPVQFSLKQRAGRPTLSGADLLTMARARDGFRPVMAFAPDATEPAKDYAVDELIDELQQETGS